jgi:hypothetical protein
MRAAPPVAVSCTGGRRWRLLNAVLPALAASAFAAWLLQRAGSPSLVGALAAAAVCGGWAWRRSAATAVALAWDGQRWLANGTAGRLAVMIDIGPALLLRLQREGGGGPMWVPVTAREAGTAWHALRAAVYSRPPETTSRVLLPERAAD